MTVHDKLKAAGITPTRDAHKAYEMGRKDGRSGAPKAPKLKVMRFRPNAPRN